MAAGYRSVLPHPFFLTGAFPHGDGPVCPPIHQIWRLDDFSRPSGRLPPSSCPPSVQEVSAFLPRRSGVSVLRSMLWFIIRTSSLHSCHGPGLLCHASFWVPDPSLFRRLVGPWILPAGDHEGEGLPSRFMCRARDSCQLAQELPHAFSALGLPGNDSSVFSFEVFSDSDPGAEGSLSRRRILLLSHAASQSLALRVRGDVLPDHPHSGLQVPDAVTPATSSGVSPSGFSDSVSLLGRLLPEGSSVVVQSVPSRGRGGLIPSTSGAPALHRRLRLGLGSIYQLRPSLRLVVSRCFTLFHQPPRASGCLPYHSGFSPSPQGQDSVFVHQQHVGSVIPPQGGRHALVHAQLNGSGDSPPLRGFRCSSAPPVCSGSPECIGGLSQLEGSGPLFRMDPPSGGVPRSLPPLPVTVDLFATSINHRLQVYFSPMADPQAVDALIQPWDHLQA